MQKTDHRKEPGALRGLIAVLVLFVVSVLAGALIAPFVFNLLTWMGREFVALQSLRNTEFERVASRCVQVAVLFALYPALRLGGLCSWSRLGFGRDARWRRRFGYSFLISASAMLVVYLLGIGLRAYKLAPEWDGEMVTKPLMYLLGALLVGVLEEFLFRGVVFGVLRKGLGFIVGMFLSSTFFALIHFAKPDPVVGVVYGKWYSGLSLLPHMFGKLAPDYPVFPFIVTLFLMGCMLCLLYEVYGNLYVAIGMHAGMVWIMRIGIYFMSRRVDVYPVLFGSGMYITDGYMSLLVMSIFFFASLGLLLWTKYRGRYEGCECC